MLIAYQPSERHSPSITVCRPCWWFRHLPASHRGISQAGSNWPTAENFSWTVPFACTDWALRPTPAPCHACPLSEARQSSAQASEFTWKTPPRLGFRAPLKFDPHLSAAADRSVVSSIPSNFAANRILTHRPLHPPSHKMLKSSRHMHGKDEAQDGTHLPERAWRTPANSPAEGDSLNSEQLHLNQGATQIVPEIADNRDAEKVVPRHLWC